MGGGEEMTGWVVGVYSLASLPSPFLPLFTFLSLPCFSAVCSSISLHQYFHRCFRTGMRLKSAVIGLVYKKALKIRPGQSKGKEAKEEGAEQGKVKQRERRGEWWGKGKGT